MLANGKIASLVCSAALDFSSVLKGLQLRFFVSAVSPSPPLCCCSGVPGVGLHLSVAWPLTAPVVLRLLSCRMKALASAPNVVTLFSAFTASCVLHFSLWLCILSASVPTWFSFILWRCCLCFTKPCRL